MNRDRMYMICIMFMFMHTYSLPPNFMLRRCINPEAQNTNVVFCFSHGLGATLEQGTKIFSHVKIKNTEGHYTYNQRWIMQDPLALFNFPDAKNGNNEFHKSEVNLGQTKDIERLKYACDCIKKEMPELEGIILMGVSRGASTAFNYAATSKDPYIKALVLESPPDDLKSIVHHLLRRFKIHWLPFSYKIGMKIAEKQFPSLRRDGIFPIKVAKYIPSNVPILLIHSKKDKVVPIYSSRNLYAKLCNTGHKNVYLYELDEGEHGKTLKGKSGLEYQHVVHAFYKKYRLPHDPDFAQLGESLLQKSQPPVASIQKLLKKKKYRSFEDDNISEDEIFDMVSDIYLDDEIDYIEKELLEENSEKKWKE